MSCNLEQELSNVRHVGRWNTVHGATATSVALPAQNATAFRDMVIVARETAMVLMIQIAFRAMLLLRRWNY